MNKFFKLASAFALLASTQAFAIIGVGAHYITNLGSLKGATETLDGGITLEREKASTLQGLGFKLWIDLLPIIDIEGTFNIAAARYNTTLIMPNGNKIPLTYSPDAPYSMIFDKASPIYGLVTGDLSVTYPFDLLPIITPYLGAGVSYMASIPLVDKKLVGNMLDNFDPNNPNEMGEEISKALKDSDYETGIAGHLIGGVRLKLPIIPIAVYANAKYYFGGNTSSKFTQGPTFEVGGGFAL